MIKLLDEKLVSQIAAGEVIERPASVVKELIENSIDAEADEIKVFIEEGGIKKITVIDNGKGIEKDDLLNVFVNHATSKISNVDDLDNILSLGFRGEAMASIDSVSNVTLISRAGDDIAYKVSNGEVTPGSHNRGTTIIIENLFHNIPARKKFLKTDATEFKYIMDIVTKIALAHPTVGFEVFNNGKNLLTLMKNQSLEERVKDILRTDSLVHVSYDGKIKVDGYVSDPKNVNQRPINQYIIVNGRPIISNFINRAIVQAYGTNIMRGQYPAYVVKIEVPTNEIDVNVHPRKSEVRFKNESEIFQSVYYAVKDNIEKFQKSFISGIGNRSFETTDQDARSFLDEKIEPPQGFTKKFDVQAALEFSHEIVKDIPKQTSFEKGNVDKIEESRVEEIKNSDIDNTECLQVNNSYIVTYNSNGIQIVDQHAAAERFLFEKYYKMIKESGIENQLLSFSINLGLTPLEISGLEENKELLLKSGFQIDPFGQHDYQLRSLPMNVKPQEAVQIIKEILNDIGENKKGGLETIYTKIAASLACHSAVRFGDKLSVEEMKKIISDLKTCEKPYTCPHGRPTVHTITNYDLQKTFKRIV